MSVINFTLIIQAINFFIAFFIIKYFFFKAAVSHINVEDKLQQSLITIVQEHQLAIAHKEQEINAHWQSVKNYFVQNGPAIRAEPFFIAKRPSIVIPHFDHAQIVQGAKDLAQALIKQVDHVR